MTARWALYRLIVYRTLRVLSILTGRSALAYNPCPSTVPTPRPGVGRPIVPYAKRSAIPVSPGGPPDRSIHVCQTISDPGKPRLWTRQACPPCTPTQSQSGVNTDYNNKVGTRVLDDTTLGAGAGMKARMWVERNSVIDNERLYDCTHRHMMGPCLVL